MEDKDVTISFSSEILNQGTDVDALDDGIPLLVSAYVQEIYQHLWHLETQHRVPRCSYRGIGFHPG